MSRVYLSSSNVAVVKPLVTPGDEDIVGNWCWRRSSGYVIRGPYGKRATNNYRPQVSLHREVLQRMLKRPLQKFEITDHVNGNRDDNRRENLRLATKSQNGYNRGSVPNSISKYSGVTRVKGKNLFQAYLDVEGVRVLHTKRKSEDECAWLYDQYAIQLHGEFARLNFEYFEVTAGRPSKENE